MLKLSDELRAALAECAETAAAEAVRRVRKTLVQDQINKARAVYREQASLGQGNTGTLALIPRAAGTVRFHTLVAVVGATTGNITITLGGDQMVFPQNPPGGYIFFDGMEIFLGRGDARSLVIATPGNPLFFGLYGERVGDDQWVI